MSSYPKRLIEVDLPIKKISDHSRREKSIRQGHIATLHIWWARRPLAACRAVLCASLWPDPADENCPESFRKSSVAAIIKFVKESKGLVTYDHASSDVRVKWEKIEKNPSIINVDTNEGLLALREALFDFIADFANWDNISNSHYLETARFLTRTAHEALDGEKGTRPMVVDPFAGGGSIPLEVLAQMYSLQT